MPLKTPPRILAAALAMGAIAPALAPAQEPLLEIHSAGLDALATSPKDAATMGAIRMLGQRLAELEGELELQPEEGELIRLGWDVLTGAMALRIQTTDDEAGVAMALSSRPMGAGAAPALRDRIIALAQVSGMPFEQDDAGGALFGTPMGPASLRVVGEGDGAMTSLTMGAIEPASLDVPRYDLPDGATPVLSVRANLATISGMMLPFLEMQDPMVAQAVGGSGWVGPEAPTVQAAVGFSGDAMHFVSRMINARAAMTASGLDPETTFSQAHLRAAPEDTVRLYAFPFTFGAVIARLEAAAGGGIREEISRELGVDLAPIIDNVGPRIIAYQADSTGGGGLLSTVLVAELADPEAFADAHRDLVDRLNALAGEEARGYARIASRDHAGAEVFTLTTPGLPIPLELSWAVARGTLVVAATPTGLEVALAQIQSPGRSVLDNAMFHQAVGGMMPAAGASSVMFADTPRLAGRGYGLTSLLVSGIANATRSPAEPDRVSTALMPTFARFVEGVRPSATVAVWEGDDYVTRSTADRSMLVLLACGAASVSDLQGVAVPAFGAGALLPALGRSREVARQTVSAATLRGVMQGVVIYGMDHDESMPESFGVLIEAGIITPEMLESPYGPAADGGPDIAVWFDLPGERAFSFEADQVVAIDRAMLLETGYQTNVGFADNHVELLSTWELEEYLALPKNEGARGALGIPDL